MKKALWIPLLTTLIPASLSAQIIFEDTFERPNADDINASVVGITNNTGSDLSAGAWTENYNAGGVSARTNIGGGTAGDGGNDANNGNPGRLFLADGAGTSNVYINHNFTNASILSAGGFSVGLDISQVGTIDDAGQIAAFAIGMTEAEAMMAGDANSGNNAGDENSKFQDAVQDPGNTAADIAISDFWVALRGIAGSNNATLIWGTRGDTTSGTVDTGPAFLGSAVITNGSGGGNLAVNFAVPDFNAATTVSFEVIFNGISRGTGNFQWSDTDSNYIGLDGRGMYIGYHSINISEFDPSGPAATLTATPDSISTGSSAETITLDWTSSSVPPGATYLITADKAVTFPNSDNTGILASPNDSGTVDAIIDGSLGDVTFTLEILDSGSAVLTDTIALVTTTAPNYTSSQTAVRYAETSDEEFFSIILESITGLPTGATYMITDNNPEAVSYDIPTSGPVEDPLYFDMTLNPSMGSVTFTVELRDSAGVVFDTMLYTVIAAAEAPTTVVNLFSDDFSRYTGTLETDNDIDASNEGMTGTVAPTDTPLDFYREVFEGSGFGDSLQINGFNALTAALGPGMSGWGINHNFIDPQIAIDGGLSISLDVALINSDGTDQSDRYVGFGMGMTESEINSFADEATIVGNGPRGGIEADVSRGLADFYVSVSQSDMVQIFANGIIVGEFPVDGNGRFGEGGLATPAVGIRADLAFADSANYSAGSFVYYTVYCNDLSVSSGYFQLSNTAANFIGFSARASGSTEMDDLAIATISSADMPYPGDPADPAPSIVLSNAATAAGVVTSFDIDLTGQPGVFYEIQKSARLLSFEGIGSPGAAIPNFPSGTRFGAADQAGAVAIPGITPPAEFDPTAFYRGKAFHWPAQ